MVLPISARAESPSPFTRPRPHVTKFCVVSGNAIESEALAPTAKRRIFDAYNVVLHKTAPITPLDLFANNFTAADRPRQRTQARLVAADSPPQSSSASSLFGFIAGTTREAQTGEQIAQTCVVTFPAPPFPYIANETEMVVHDETSIKPRSCVVHQPVGKRRLSHLLQLLYAAKPRKLSQRFKPTVAISNN